MEIYQLRQLVAFAQCGSISKAAETVGVSQPAMSRSMKNLEADFGVPLFTRTKNTIALNGTGKLAARLAGEITDRIDDAVSQVREHERMLRTVLIGSEAPAPLWRVLSVLSASEKEKTVSGELKERGKLIEGIRNGSYRMIVTTEPVTLSGFSTLRLGEENLMFLLQEDHPLAERKSLSFSDLDGENMLLYEDIGFWRGLPERMMPNSRFLVQSDREAFEELVEKSSIPSFTADVVYRKMEGKKAIPITDREAHVEYYLTGRPAELGLMTRMARTFSTVWS